MVQEFDANKAQAFAGKMAGALNSAMLTVMGSIGHQTGLFDTMAGMAPSSSVAIAAAANLNERYVREWLGAMATGGVVEYDAEQRTYRLPPEHASVLTRAAGIRNMAATMQFVPDLSQVEQQVVIAFKEGGGVPYSEYPRFQMVMRESSAQRFDATLLDVTLHLIPGLVSRLEDGIDVADVGCGAGHAINLMAARFPKSRFVGYDFGERALEVGRAEAASLGLTNARFEARDAAHLGIHSQFDFVTIFDAVHDQAHPDLMLASVSAMLKPGGDLLCVDVSAHTELADNLSHPMGTFLYSVSTLHCMTVSLAYGGVGLGTAWGQEKALEMLAEAGFRNVSVQRVPGDALNNYYIARK